LCGIVGIWIKNSSAASEIDHLKSAVKAIQHRGPDHLGIKKYAKLGLGHARLSIIDLSESAHQPMVDQTERYSIAFNGEIYNFQELKKSLVDKGVSFQTESDTEVLLHHLIENGMDGIKDLNGFFSFLFYDNTKEQLYFARDRYGIKPLYKYEDADKIIFSSEINALFQFNIDRTINHEALHQLFGLTYIPGPLSILKHAEQVLPGYYGKIEDNKVSTAQYYDLDAIKLIDVDFETAKIEVKLRLENAVKLRLVADVDLGTFLSGGVDSSIISLISNRLKNDLNTYSVGFDSTYFDESQYAKIMADKIGSTHHNIQLNQSDFKSNFNDFLQAIDEPFGDSSAFAVYLLCQYAKTNTTVCLSGDGADEIFGGYRKYAAEFKIRQLSARTKFAVKLGAKLLKLTRQNRSGKWGEMNRKVQKLNKGLNLSISERYWQWANFIDANDRMKLLLLRSDGKQFETKISDTDLNAIFRADQKLVLPNDMLTKVDRMSMRHALEVRTPFLDHNVVDYVNSLPAEFKVNGKGRKQILIEAFKDDLPEAIYNREKKGFEIPIYDWLDEELQAIFNSKIFSKKYIENQGLFNYDYICSLQKEWGSKQFGDRIYLVWTLIIFQNWWNRQLYLNDEENKSFKNH